MTEDPDRYLTARQRQAKGLGPGPAREQLVYANPGEAYKLGTGYVDPDVPEEGFYTYRLSKNAVLSAIKIWYGPPHDPVTGEEMDRGWRWQATLNGSYVDLPRIWPNCAKSRIDEKEYNRLMGLQEWGRRVDPDGAFANPRKPIDPLDAPLPF